MRRAFLLVVVISSVFVSCTPELDTSGTSCLGLESTAPGGFTTESYGEFRYYSPCFNPLDSNQFVYVRETTASGVFELIKHTISANNDSILTVCTNDIAPKWGKKGLILYGMGATVNMIDDETGEITPAFPDTYIHTNPDWDAKGEKIISHYNNGGIEGTMISDMDGIVLHTSTDMNYYNGGWYPNKDKIAFPYGSGDDYGLVWTDSTLSDTTHYHTIKLYSDLDLVSSIVWYKNQQDMLWVTDRTVNVTNINNGNTRRLLENCEEAKYLVPSISGSGKQFLFQKEIKSKVSETELFVEDKIVLMNLDGSGETDILF